MKTPSAALRDHLSKYCQHCQVKIATQDATFDFENADPPLKHGPTIRTFQLCDECVAYAYALLMENAVTSEEFCDTMGPPIKTEPIHLIDPPRFSDRTMTVLDWAVGLGTIAAVMIFLLLLFWVWLHF